MLKDLLHQDLTCRKSDSLELFKKIENMCQSKREAW